jgi:hypothetical protein
MFNHILLDFFAMAILIVEQAKLLSLSFAYLAQSTASLASAVVNLETPLGRSMSDHHCKLSKKHKAMYEQQLLWRTKLTRMGQGTHSLAFEYFVRREVMRKMKEEEKDPDEQVFFVPFTVKE